VVAGVELAHTLRSAALLGSAAARSCGPGRDALACGRIALVSAVLALIFCPPAEAPAARLARAGTTGFAGAALRR